MMGWNGNFESWVTAGTVYDRPIYIKFTDLEKGTWGDYVPEDRILVIIAVQQSSAAPLLSILFMFNASISNPVDDSGACLNYINYTTGAPTVPAQCTTTLELIEILTNRGR